MGLSARLNLLISNECGYRSHEWTSTVFTAAHLRVRQRQGAGGGVQQRSGGTRGCARAASHGERQAGRGGVLRAEVADAASSAAPSDRQGVLCVSGMGATHAPQLLLQHLRILPAVLDLLVSAISGQGYLVGVRTEHDGGHLAEQRGNPHSRTGDRRHPRQAGRHPPPRLPRRQIHDLHAKEMIKFKESVANE